MYNFIPLLSMILHQIENACFSTHRTVLWIFFGQHDIWYCRVMWWKCALWEETFWSSWLLFTNSTCNFEVIEELSLSLLIKMDCINITTKVFIEWFLFIVWKHVFSCYGLPWLFLHIHGYALSNKMITINQG